MSQGTTRGGGVQVDSVQAALRLDDAGGGVTYVGEAGAGSSESAAVWRVKRIIETGGDISITWASGTTSFDKIWDNRAIMPYS